MKSSHCTKYERNIREISALEEFILYRPLIKLQNVPLTYSLWSYQNTALKYYYQIMRQIRRRKYFQKHHLLTQRYEKTILPICEAKASFIGFKGYIKSSHHLIYHHKLI